MSTFTQFISKFDSLKSYALNRDRDKWQFYLAQRCGEVIILL